MKADIGGNWQYINVKILNINLFFEFKFFKKSVLFIILKLFKKKNIKNEINIYIE